MEKMKVFGKQNLDFTGRDGNQVRGVVLHCTTNPPNQYWEGEGYEKLFFPNNSPMIPEVVKLPVGSVISVSFNRFGRPDSFTVEK